MRDRTPDIQMFEDTIQILKQGFYEKDGRKIQLKLAAREREDIQVYLPDDVKNICNNPEFKPVAVESDGCIHSCENIDSYALARKRVAEGAEQERRKRTCAGKARCYSRWRAKQPVDIMIITRACTLSWDRML